MHFGFRDADSTIARGVLSAGSTDEANVRGQIGGAGMSAPSRWRSWSASSKSDRTLERGTSGAVGPMASAGEAAIGADGVAARNSLRVATTGSVLVTATGTCRSGTTRLSEKKRILEVVRKGKTALCRIRWVVGSTWLAISFIIFIVHQLSRRYLWHADYSFWCKQSFGVVLKEMLRETLFDLRLLLSSLGPLADDCILTRVVLLADVVAFGYGRATLLRRLIGGDWATAAPFQRAIYCINLFRGATVALLFLWSATLRSAPRMQKWMWRTITYFAVTNIVEEVMRAIYDVVALKIVPVKLGQLPPNLCLLYLVHNSELLRRAQRWLQLRLLAAEAKSAAASIACMIGPGDPSHAFDQAKQRFRCLRLADLSLEELRDNTPDPNLDCRARPAKLGRCDAFISHSWHDDPEAKWEALQSWKADFVQSRGREPKVWFDKLCIDQKSIDIDLRCLPIFLSGCRRLVILCGPTYLSRLWCIFEIFSFVMMGGTSENVDLIPVVAAGCEESEIMNISAIIDHFDAGCCHCFRREDKDKMLYIVRTAFGSIHAFNQEVLHILHDLHHETRWSARSSSTDESDEDSSDGGVAADSVQSSSESDE